MFDCFKIIQTLVYAQVPDSWFDDLDVYSINAYTCYLLQDVFSSQELIPRYRCAEKDDGRKQLAGSAGCLNLKIWPPKKEHD